MIDTLCQVSDVEVRDFHEQLLILISSHFKNMDIAFLFWESHIAGVKVINNCGKEPALPVHANYHPLARVHGIPANCIT